MLVGRVAVAARRLMQGGWAVVLLVQSKSSWWGAVAARLRLGGFRLLDCQFMNRHLEQFGAVPLHRVAFRKFLDQAIEVTAAFPEHLSDLELRQFLQSKSQTSNTGCSMALSAGEDANIQPWKTGVGSRFFGNS